MNITEQLKNLYRECFPEDKEQTAEFLFNDRLWEKNALYLQENGSLSSAMYLVDKKLRYKGNTIDLPYVVALGTAKNFRNRGCAAKLLENALNVLNSCSVPFVALYPFNHGFYEHFQFITPSFDLNAPDVPFSACPIQDAMAVYEEFCSGLDYYIVRSEKDFASAQKILSFENEEFGLLGENGEIIGYRAGEEYIPRLYSRGTDKGTMIRIVNAKSAMKVSKLTLDKRIKLIDDLIPANNFCFRLHEGETTVIDEYDLTIDIIALGEIIFGLKDLYGKKTESLRGYLADRY